MDLSQVDVHSLSMVDCHAVDMDAVRCCCVVPAVPRFSGKMVCLLLFLVFSDSAMPGKKWSEDCSPPPLSWGLQER